MHGLAGQFSAALDCLVFCGHHMRFDFTHSYMHESIVHPIHSADCAPTGIQAEPGMEEGAMKDTEVSHINLLAWEFIVSLLCSCISLSPKRSSLSFLPMDLSHALRVSLEHFLFLTQHFFPL